MREIQVQQTMTMLGDYTNRLTTLTGLSPTLFLSSTCTKLSKVLKKDNQGAIEGALEQFGQQSTTFKNLRSDICTLEAKLLSLDGFSEEMSILHSTNRRISHIITSLEDLLLIASEGYETFEHTCGYIPGLPMPGLPTDDDPLIGDIPTIGARI